MGGKSGFPFKFWLFIVFLTFISSSLMIETPVLAQDDEGEFQLEEIVVTGSRIQRRDNESKSPIVTIEAEEFEQQSGLNIEAYLNQMPEYNPAASPTTSQGDVQVTPINSVGVATISLRGFGPNRNLTLIDGKRGVPVNALMWTDINGIPSALIQRSETISGGASAVYGADAIGGVTNFILKKDFEGAEIDAQYGITEAGDGEESRVSMLMGTNLADGRGNITFGVERYERKKAEAKERDWYTERWADPYASGYFSFLMGTNAYYAGANGPNVGAAKALFGGELSQAWYYNFFLTDDSAYSNATFNFNPDGTLWVGGNQVGESRSTIDFSDSLLYQGRYMCDNQSSSCAETFLGTKWNNLNELASAPQERYSIYANGHYDLTDKITLKGGARFAQSKTRTLLMGNNAITGWEATVPYNPETDSPIDPDIDYTDPDILAAVQADPAAFFADPDNANPNFIATGEEGAQHPVPAELAWLLNSRTDPDARWQPNWNTDTSIPMRQTTNTIQTWQIEGGLDFELPFDWTGELYLTHGESSTYNVASGNLSLARYRALINLPDWGRGAEGNGNEFYVVDSENGTEIVYAASSGFGAGDYTCTSGLYDTIFGGDQAMSEDCLNAISAKLQTHTEMTQDIYELNFQGGVFELPAGEVRTAVGYQYRKVHGEFNPDILQSEDSWTDQVIGVYPTGYLDASTTVNDGYVEALIPVLSDKPLIEKLELELGARYSDYKDTGDNEWTYKTMASWQPKQWLRFRAGYNRAIRSPNLGELYLNPQEFFSIGTTNYGDPCSVRSNAPWGAGGTTLAVDEFIKPADYDYPGSPAEADPSIAAGQTQAGADYTQQLCEAMMGETGAAYYYEGIDEGVDTVKDFQEQTTGSISYNWLIQVGNPDLKPETADTYTLGFVMNSPLENPLLSGITLAFDYYDIKIEDAIMLYSIDYANYRCFGTGMDAGLTPEEQALSSACLLVARSQDTGGALNTVLSFDNQATIDTSGYDIMLNWHADIRALGIDVPGSLNLNVKATVLDSYVTKQSPLSFDLPIEWKGTLGPTLSGTQAGAYDYRLFTTLTYNNVRHPWSVSLRWRHLPGVWAAGYASEKARIKNNKAAYAAGEYDNIITYTPGTYIKTPSYNVFDLSGNWDINETWSIRFGINNLFQKDPPSVGSTAGYNSEEYPDLSTVCSDDEEALGCTDPTAYSVYSRGSYSGGYYDTIGRRFFLGVKARF